MKPYFELQYFFTILKAHLVFLYKTSDRYCLNFTPYWIGKEVGGTSLHCRFHQTNNSVSKQRHGRSYWFVSSCRSCCNWEEKRPSVRFSALWIVILFSLELLFLQQLRSETHFPLWKSRCCCVSSSLCGVKSAGLKLILIRVQKHQQTSLESKRVRLHHPDTWLHENMTTWRMNYWRRQTSRDVRREMMQRRTRDRRVFLRQTHHRYERRDRGRKRNKIIKNMTNGKRNKKKN